MNRGSAVWGEETDLGYMLASMRPRFMNRGSSGPLGALRGRFRASMRPRFMNRGSGSPIDWTTTEPKGFNEAPIHESGK